MPVTARVEIEGLRELQRALRSIGGMALQQELGALHRQIGEIVIAAAGGRSTGVGTGWGEQIRPSSAARSVQLRVGGGHRDIRPRQWGRTQIWPGGLAPFRPFLIGAAISVKPQIESAYLSGVGSIVRRHGIEWQAGSRWTTGW